MTDWQSIKAEYEQGASQHSLAAKYGISQPAISKKALKEGWSNTPVIIPRETVITDNLVDRALADLALHLTGDPKEAKLQLNQHKLFADSFSQYMKAKLLAPEQEAARQGVDWSMFTEQELEIIQPIFEQAFARQLHHKEQAS